MPAAGQWTASGNDIQIIRVMLTLLQVQHLIYYYTMVGNHGRLGIGIASPDYLLHVSAMVPFQEM